MKCALVGSRYFGATVFEALRKEAGVEFTRVVVPAAAHVRGQRIDHRRKLGRERPLRSSQPASTTSTTTGPAS